jgi:hypothetical protein
MFVLVRLVSGTSVEANLPVKTVGTRSVLSVPCSAGGRRSNVVKEVEKLRKNREERRAKQGRMI